MRTIPLLVAAAGLACATSPPEPGEQAPERRATSVASVGTGGDRTSPVIRVQAGDVRVFHTVPSGARLRATLLEGLDATNRHLRYEWDQNGTYAVAVSGRYRHSVTGSIVGGGSLPIQSTLTYTPMADTATAFLEPAGPKGSAPGTVTRASRIPPGPDRPPR